MKRVTKMAVTAGAAIALGLAAAAVSAHPYGQGWGGHMGGYGPGMMGGYGPGYGMGPQAMFNAYPGASDAQLAGLKSEIGITDKQEGAWKGFVDSVKKQDENRRAWFAKMRAARSAGSAPELLAQQTEILKQREAELAASAAAVKNLYAALTPEQQAIADQNLGSVCPGWTQGYRGGPRGYAR